MPWVNDIINNLQIAIDSFWYNILMMLASLHWGLMRSFLLSGYTIQVANDWLIREAFAPLIQYTGDSLKVATSFAFIVALFVLGITYMLAAIVRLNVVSPRNAILWYLAGLLFFQAGPSLYQGMSDFRRSIGSLFYASVLQSMQQSSGSAFSSLNSVKSTDLGILTPCDNFGPYLGRPGGGGVPVRVNGLDVALAYLRADGIDILGYPYPTSDNCQPHPPIGNPPSYIQPLPWEWYRPGSYFDLTTGAPFSSALTPEQRAASISMASAAQGRLFSAWPLVFLGLMEQVVALCLTIAQGLTFVSFSCAILFAFFKRTEVIAWAVVDQWIELIVQTVILALLQALVVSFFLAAAATNNSMVSMGVGLLCLIFMVMLMVAGLRAIWSALNRLFNAMGQATGGSIIGLGGATRTVIGATTGIAGASLGVAGATLGSAAALANGASLAQTAGVALGGNPALYGASIALSRLPGVRDTALGEVADHFAEGATVRRVGGPAIGSLLLTERGQRRQAPGEVVDDEGLPVDVHRAPTSGGVDNRSMLVPAVGDSLRWLTTAPFRHRQPGAESVGDAAENTPHQRMGRFTPWRADETDLDEVIGADARRTAQSTAATLGMPADRRPAAEEGATRLSISGAHLERAGERLGQAAESLTQTVRRQALEGRLEISGARDVAGVLGDTVALLHGQGSADHLTVGRTMAETMGLNPVGSTPPISRDLTRFSLFTNDALRLGLTGNQAEQVILEVKQSGQLAPQTHDDLIRQGRSHSLPDPSRAVERLEHLARALPEQITAQGRVSVPLSTPAVIQKPESEV